MADTTEMRNEKDDLLVCLPRTSRLFSADCICTFQNHFQAQGKLLADAQGKVSSLETKIKEEAHKIDRLHDYEMQIEQLVKLQRLWYVLR